MLAAGLKKIALMQVGPAKQCTFSSTWHAKAEIFQKGLYQAWLGKIAPNRIKHGNRMNSGSCHVGASKISTAMRQSREQKTALTGSHTLLCDF